MNRGTHAVSECILHGRSLIRPGKLRKNVQLSGKYSFLKKPMYTFEQYLEKQLLI
jgi:hypothetical protein